MLEKQWGDEKVRERERLEKYKYFKKKVKNNYRKIEKKKDNDIDADVAQLECSNNK